MSILPRSRAGIVDPAGEDPVEDDPGLVAGGDLDRAGDEALQVGGVLDELERGSCPRQSEPGGDEAATVALGGDVEGEHDLGRRRCRVEATGPRDGVDAGERARGRATG